MLWFYMENLMACKLQVLRLITKSTSISVVCQCECMSISWTQSEIPYVRYICRPKCISGTQEETLQSISDGTLLKRRVLYWLWKNKTKHVKQGCNSLYSKGCFYFNIHIYLSSLKKREKQKSVSCFSFLTLNILSIYFKSEFLIVSLTTENSSMLYLT